MLYQVRLRPLHQHRSTPVVIQKLANTLAKQKAGRLPEVVKSSTPTRLNAFVKTQQCLTVAPHRMHATARAPSMGLKTYPTNATSMGLLLLALAKVRRQSRHQRGNQNCHSYNHAQIARCGVPESSQAPLVTLNSVPRTKLRFLVFAPSLHTKNKYY